MFAGLEDLGRGGGGVWGLFRGLGTRGFQVFRLQGFGFGRILR